MITDFDIATDLKVEMYLPDERGNIFIIGVSTIGGRDVLAGAGIFMIGESLIGGTDVLGSTETSFAWQQIECETTNAVISLGGEIQSSLYFQPEPASVQLSVQSWVWDPNNSSAVRPGTPMRVRLDNGVVEHTLFNGFLDTFDVSYYPDPTAPNVIRLNGFDIYKRLVNTRIADFDTTGLPAGYATPNEVIEIVATEAGLSLSASSDELVGKLPAEQVLNSTAARFINDATQVGLGFMWIDPESGELVVRQRPSITTVAPDGTYTIGNNHGDDYHLCMSGLSAAGDADAIFNSIYVDLASDDTQFVTVEDADSIGLYGYSSTNATINTTDTTELTRWANAVFAQAPTKLVREVSTPAIDRSGTLTEAAVFVPGTLVGVKYDTANILVDDYYTVTKVTHSIDVNNWFTNLELWREF